MANYRFMTANFNRLLPAQHSWASEAAPPLAKAFVSATSSRICAKTSSADQGELVIKCCTFCGDSPAVRAMLLKLRPVVIRNNPLKKLSA